jgi:hypothetical protein
LAMGRTTTPPGLRISRGNGMIRKEIVSCALQAPRCS